MDALQEIYPIEQPNRFPQDFSLVWTFGNLAFSSEYIVEKTAPQSRDGGLHKLWMEMKGIPSQILLSIDSI